MRVNLMEIAADYLVMAAWLAYLNTSSAADPEPEQNDEIIDMSDALRYQLCGSKPCSRRRSDCSHCKIGPARHAALPNNLAASVNLNGPHLYMIFGCYGDIQSSGEAETQP